MKRQLFFFTVLFLPLFAGCRPAAAPVAVSNRPVSINGVRQPDAPSKPIEQMSWTRTDGSEQKMQDYRDKVVILDFWATFCPPCLEEIPHLNSLQSRYGNENLQVIGLNVGGEEDQPKIPSFAKELKVAYPIAYPENALVSFIFGDETAIPQTAVFDRQGRLVLKVIGFDSRIQSELDEAVETALRQ